MKSDEHKEQVNLIQWWTYTSKSFGIDENLLFAIPNGGQRAIVVASKLKAEGVRPGIPDLLLAYPNNQYHGLFIEMKKQKGGVVSEYQKNCIKLLNDAGYHAIICHGWLDAKEAIEQYLNNE